MTKPRETVPGLPAVRRHSRIRKSNPRQDRAVTRTEVLRDGSRVPVYDQEMAFEIVQLIAGGRTLREICWNGSGYVTSSTFRRWAVEHPELGKAFKEARELSAVALEEEGLTRARQTFASPGTTTDVRATEVLLNQLRWSAARRDPTQFGERANIAIRVPVQINTSLDLGQPDAQKSVRQDNVYEVEAVVVEPEPEPGSVPALPAPKSLPSWFNGGPLPPAEEPVRIVPKNPPNLHANREQYSPAGKRILTPRIPMDAATPPSKKHRRSPFSQEADTSPDPGPQSTGDTDASE